MNKNQIIDNLLKKNRGVLIGKNGVGKTYLINELYKLDIADTITFIMNSDVETSFEFDNDNEDSITRQLINIINEQYDRKISDYSKEVLDNTMSKVNKINKAVKQTFANDFNVELQFSKKNIGSNEVLKSLPKTEDGTGHKFYYILNFVCEILKWQLDTKKSKKVLLFIDEPEKYSHPSLIIKTAKKLRQLSEKSNFHVLISTHSPLFTKYFVSDLSQIYLMRSRDNIIVYNIEDLSKNIYDIYNKDLVAKFDSSRKLVNSELLIKNYINKVVLTNIVESLFSDIVVILEGYSDRVFLDYIILNTNFNFDFNSLACNGKGLIPFFISIMKKYKVPTFTLFDEDQDKNPDKHKVYNSFIIENSDGYYSFKVNIEDYFGIKDKNQKQTFSTSEVARMLINKNKVSNKNQINDLINNFARSLEATFADVIAKTNSSEDKISFVNELITELYRKITKDYSKHDFTLYEDIYSSLKTIYESESDRTGIYTGKLYEVNKKLIKDFCIEKDIDFKKMEMQQEKKFFIKDYPYMLFDSIVLTNKKLAKEIHDKFIMGYYKYSSVKIYFGKSKDIGYADYVNDNIRLFKQKYSDKPKINDKLLSKLEDEFLFSGKIDVDAIKDNMDFKLEDSFGFREIKQLRDKFIAELENYLRIIY